MSNDLINKGMSAIMHTYNRYPIVLKSGKGVYVTDINGKSYLDFVAGIAVNVLGHGNEKLCDAISAQVRDLIHVSNYFWIEPQIKLAVKLVENSCFEKAFFCNSGAEAIEGSLKLSRKYANKEHPDRYEIIAMEHSFHGRTYGAITATGQEKYRKGLDPLLPGIKHVPYNDFEALQLAVSDKTCAILLEPIQGEGGVHPADREYLQSVRKLCNDNDIMLIFDEVQCGVGRTGYLFAYEYYGVCPDALALAKGMAGGVPIGVLLTMDKFASAFQPGDHASTFGGNPLATAAANVVLDELLENGLLENVKKQGEYLTNGLNKLKEKHSDKITDVRGTGLLQGIELKSEVAPVINTCIENGLLLISAGTNVIRFVPPLIVTEADIDKALEILDNALKS